LVALAWTSNIAFLVGRAALEGRLQQLADPRIWPSILTFQRDATISAILLPTALLLFLLPWLVRWEMQSPRLFAAFALLAFTTAWATRWALASVDATVLGPLASWEGPGGFSLLPLACNGVLGLAIGLYGCRYASRRGPLSRLEALAALLAFGASLHALSRAALVQETAGSILRFLIILAAGLAIGRSAPRVVRHWLSLVGRFSLFAFFVHRVLLQFGVAAFRSTAPSPDALYVELTVMTVATLVGLCALRSHYPPFNRLFKTIGV
jgi:hypothetical protein